MSSAKILEMKTAQYYIDVNSQRLSGQARAEITKLKIILWSHTKQK
jgi:hypothetical protein